LDADPETLNNSRLNHSSYEAELAILPDKLDNLTISDGSAFIAKKIIGPNEFYTGEVYNETIPNGRGVLYNSEELFIQDGVFINGKFSRGKMGILKEEGVEHWEEGTFSILGVLNGKDCVQFKNGDTWKGDWSEGL
jgi:hypothetical protein